MTDSGATSLLGLSEIADVGRDRIRGGYSRHVFDSADQMLREWFIERATRIGLDVERDRNGNLWAWWGTPGPNALVTGSHLDSVPGGGAFDGPLGVVSALDSIARLRAEGVQPTRPVAIVVFAEEEGSRFGVACLGSRLLSGAITAERALALTDADGITFADAARASSLRPEHMGLDSETLSRIGLFVELHVEQGRRLIDLDAPVGIASSILAHGRWRLSFTGQANHAGATPMRDRRDPVVAAAATVAAVPTLALDTADARATVGRMNIVPGGTNVIASRVDVWVDVRADEDHVTRELVDRIRSTARDWADRNGCAVTVTEESWTGRVDFDEEPRNRFVTRLGGAPVLPTGAGHDAGVLAGTVPTAMLFVRNPTGVSHAPEEWASRDDCEAGIDALVSLIGSEA